MTGLMALLSEVERSQGRPISADALIRELNRLSQQAMGRGIFDVLSSLARESPHSGEPISVSIRTGVGVITVRASHDLIEMIQTGDVHPTQVVVQIAKLKTAEGVVIEITLSPPLVFGS